MAKSAKYSMIITEKPSSAEKIADALAEGKAEKLKKRGISYFRLRRSGKDILVVPAVGHLFILSHKGGSAWSYPVFSVEWKPTFMNKGSQWAKAYYENIKELAKGADEFISACDYDVEGSTIAFNVLRFLCGSEDGKRMIFSTLTKPDLVSAYDNASPHLDFPHIEAGLARHHLDFFFGINLSRALIISLKSAGGYRTLSIGRVQGPTLKMLKDRQDEISRFKPNPFWELELHGKVNGEDIVALHIRGKFWKKDEVEETLKKSRGPAEVSGIEKKKHEQAPPLPFDLTTLQREAYGSFGYSPKRTLDVAQSLYEQALISYPRTSSQKLPRKIGYDAIIQGLAKQKKYSGYCKSLKTPLKPREGPKKDPAHPSIFPTGNPPKTLTEQEKRLYDMIVRRFLSVFAEDAVREAAKASIQAGSEIFVAHGIITLKPGWLEIYGPYARLKEQALPDMKAGDPVDVKEINLLEKETQPPKRYTQATVLKEMEKLGLGTKGTRAHIIQTLYDREYIRETSIHVTELGEVVVSTLEKHCPEILSTELTRDLEKRMQAMQEGRLKKESMISEAKEFLKKILKEMKPREQEIGKSLLKGVIEAEKTRDIIGPCAKCGVGKLKIIKSMKTGKRFAACNEYPKCRNTFPLPQKGGTLILKDKCSCGLSIISIKQYRRRPWKLCAKCGFVEKREKPETEDSKKPAAKKS